ncbi:MAG: thioredoxin fold domain-containing protein [Bosea sp. (in: a-proteobacteria)]
MQQHVARGLGVLALAIGAFAVSAAKATELLMFDRSGCVWCERWDRDVGVIYDKTVEGKRAPLKRINVDRDKLEGVQLKASVRYTPTFVLVDKGREIGRITGYLNDDQFWGLLGSLLAKTGQPKPKLDES